MLFCFDFSLFEVAANIDGALNSELTKIVDEVSEKHMPDVRKPYIILNVKYKHVPVCVYCLF